MEKIIVSVLMPARNAEHTIHKAIESISNQTFQSWELLVYDDCSNDQTSNIVNDVIKTDDRVRLLKQNGKSGIANARNVLQSAAQGQYIINMDSDDYSKPERIQKMYERAQEEGHPCLIGSNFEIYKDGEFFRYESFPEHHDQIAKKLSRYFFRYSISAGQILGSAYLYKNTPIRSRYPIMSDWDQLLRIIENYHPRLANVQDYLYIYYLNKNSVTRKKFKRSIYSAFLRENEYRRKSQKNEHEDVRGYIINMVHNPFAFIRNVPFIGLKYIQQFLEY